MDDYQSKRSAQGFYRHPREIERNVTDLASGQFTVTTTPQQLSSYASNRRIVTRLTNLSGAPVYYGPTNSVSPSTGGILAPGAGQWTEIVACSVIWVVVASGTALISWQETYE